MEAYGQFIIKAQETFKGNAGAGADLTIMAESYKTLSYVKQLAYSSNKLVQVLKTLRNTMALTTLIFWEQPKQTEDH